MAAGLVEVSKYELFATGLAGLIYQIWVQLGMMMNIKLNN